MLTAVRCVLSKLVSPLWRTVEVDEEGLFSAAAGKRSHKERRRCDKPPPPRALALNPVSFVWSHASFARSGTKNVRTLRDGVVTQLCLDYGMIDHAVCFTRGEVLCGSPLKEGDLVNCIAVQHGAHGGWNALRVSVR